MLDRKTLLDAGVMPRHITRVIGVSRVTASKWLNGKAQPDPLREPLVEKFTNAVRQAMKDNVLPVSKMLPYSEREVRTIAAIMERMK